MAKRKCRKIVFITDGRFGGTRKKLVGLDKRLKKSGVNIVREGKIRTLHFSAKGLEKASRQWRKSYVITKNVGEVWDDVYKAVNKIQAPYYKPVNC